MPRIMGSGTIKTLAALLAALTLGTFALMLMETAPARPMVPLPPLRAMVADGTEAALRLIDPGESKLAYLKWRNIVIHDAGHDGAGVVQGCHFVISGGGAIEPTKLWRSQADGRHVQVPGFDYNANSIGICIMSDTGRGAPTESQREALYRLVKALQASLQVRPDHVYLHNQLGQQSCPGKFFDDEDLRSHLLAGSR